MVMPKMKRCMLWVSKLSANWGQGEAKRRSSFEGFFASKGAAYALPDGDFARRATKHGGEMQLHLQAMVNLLRDEDVLRLVVKLECQYPNRIRYLTIVSAFGPDEEEQSIVIGVDWTDKATIGLVVPLYRDTTISLDGDGGFKMTSAGKANIFKPISVQTMWTALQWIHKCADNARRHNYFFPNGSSHAWAEYYNRKISSDRVCLNEWHQMEDILSKRPESPIGTSKEKELVMKLIRHKLREIMARVDLEDVTSRQVRNMLEEDTQMELREYRSFIDEEMFTILGQMDSASQIFDHVYLGSEWNASNLEELKENGVGYILNITREIDNFFPGTFHYHNIRVYDVEETELLHHWDNTYKFIQKAKKTGSKVLVHCRMGISRSASTVIAYGMKEYGWSLGDTMKYVKARRSVVQPNAGFWKQLITYEGILNSSKHRYNKLFTSKASESGPGKIKKSGKTDEQLLPEGMDTVDNLPVETESDLKGEESLEERNQDSEVLLPTTEKDSEDVRVTTEDNDDVFFCDDAVGKREDGDSVEQSKEEVEETDSVQANSRVLQNDAIEKTTLYRVSSVPALPSDEKTKQKSNTQTTGNFQRSRSLRERGPKKVEQLRNCMEGRAASDENVTEFGLKKKEMFESAGENVRLNEPDESLEEDAISGVGSKARGIVPDELHGVLESGFVKRKSRNFEEGVQNAVPSVEQVLDDAEALEEKMDVGYAPSKSDKPTAVEGEQDLSVDSEGPEPGVVRKHKEEYELKHRESLKRGAVLQRWGSGDGSSLKRERGDGTAARDADSKLLLNEPGTETERACAVSVDALVQKVNEDMKKEVSARRISKKQQELRAFVQQAGEQMKDALTNDEDRNLMRENENSLTDLGSLETTEVPAAGGCKGNTVEEVKKRILEDPQVFVKSPDCAEVVELKEEMINGDSTSKDVEQAVSADVDPSKNVVTESTCELSENREEITGEQDKESIPQKGLVKRHTLRIEGKLQPSGDNLDKKVEDEIEKESEPVVQQETFSRSPSKEETRSAVKEIESSDVKDASSDLVTESTKTDTCDLAEKRADKVSEEVTESIQKGLVKRHTLLIEERLQPLEQALTGAENEAEKESGDQEKCSSPSKEQSRGVATITMESSVGEDVRAAEEQTEKDKNAAERKETSEFLEDTGVKVSAQDVPHKGLVKRHTLLIEGKLQPVGEELAGEGKDMDGKLDEDDQGTSRSAVFDLGKVQPNVGQDVSAENTKEAEETNKTEDGKYKTSGQEEEQLSQKGLVKRHTLVIEGKLPPVAQGIENEDRKRDELTVDQQVCSSTSVDEERRYQIERTSDLVAEDADEENQDSETMSGLVKREKLRIEKIVNPNVVEGAQSVQEEDKMVTCNDGTVFVEDRDESCGDAEKNKGDEDDGVGEQLTEQEQSEVGVDTSSVVRVKDHTQHLEGILQVTTTTKDGEKLKRQTSKEDLPKSREGTPKIVIVPRSCSDERVAQQNELSASDKLIENRMEEILSDSAVNIAIMKAQETLDLENEKFVDWDVANVKQRTRIFEEIMQHLHKDSEKDEKNSDSQVRRCGSMPKTIRPGEKYVLRRRSFSDLSETVSSSSGREVGYTIQFSDGQSSSSSSLPREWSPLQNRQEKGTWDELNTNEVFSPETNRQSEKREKNCVELIDCQDQGNDSLSVKEKIQVLDSKNHRNISNVS